MNDYLSVPVAWISSAYFESLLLPQLLRGENDSKQSDEFQASFFPDQFVDFSQSFVISHISLPSIYSQMRVSDVLLSFWCFQSILGPYRLC